MTELPENPPSSPDSNSGSSSGSGAGSGRGSASAQSPTTSPPIPAFPIAKLLTVNVGGGAALIVLWAIVHQGWKFPESVYKGVLLGLCAATAAHVGGTVLGALLTPGKGVANAYLASTLVRFVLTPLLALSLYFLLLAEARPVLIGSLAGYLLILVADIVTMMQAMQSAAHPAPSTAGRSAEKQ